MKNSKWVSKENEGRLNTPWDKFYRVSLIRSSPCQDDAPYILDFGVGYFVKKLESLGLKTCWSCEGHPSDFYIVFKAPFHKAARVANASVNYADISITRGYKKWDKKKNEIYYHKQPWWRMSLHPHPDTYEARNYQLRGLSVQWEKEL